MTIQPLIASELEAFLSENEVGFVDFWAPWCAPCNQFLKAYEQISSLFPDIQFVTVNIEEQNELAHLFEIRSIPHLVIIKQGMVVYSDAGNKPGSILKELAQQALK